MKRISAVLIATLTIVLLNALPGILTPIYAFGPTCQYSNVVYNYPDQVSPGEQFMVSISLPAVCPQTNNYHLTARFDVEDSMNRVLASNFTQDGFVPNNGKPFTFTVTNALTAPSTPDFWKLQFVVYAFISEDDALGLDYEVKAPEMIQVGQSTQLQASNNTTTSAITQSSALSNTNTPTTLQSLAESNSPTCTSNKACPMIAFVIGILLAASLLLLVRRRYQPESR